MGTNETLPVVEDNYKGAMTGVDRLLFYMAGLWQCLWAGRLGVYQELVAQAMYETKGFTSIRSKSSPWCMHAGSLTSRRDGTQTTDRGEVLAAYSGFRRYNRAWKDRLDWDKARNVPADVHGDEYVDAVLEYGRWLGAGSTPDQRERYAKGWRSYMDKVPAAVRAVDALGEFVDKPSRLWAKVLLWLLLAGITYSVLHRVFKARWPWQRS